MNGRAFGGSYAVGAGVRTRANVGEVCAADGVARQRVKVVAVIAR